MSGTEEQQQLRIEKKTSMGGNIWETRLNRKRCSEESGFAYVRIWVDKKK